MKKLIMRVTDAETREVLQEETCDLVMAICVSDSGSTEIGEGREERSTAGITFAGSPKAKAKLMITLLDAAATAISQAIRHAVERAAPIEWTARRDGLKQVSAKLKDDIKQVDAIYAFAEDLRKILKEGVGHGSEVS